MDGAETNDKMAQIGTWQSLQLYDFPLIALLWMTLQHI